ncbi:MAG: thermonuclease family protein [Hyphomonadaceae bacterium]
MAPGHPVDDMANGFRLFGCAILLLGACGKPAPLDTLARGETGRVVRIIDGDALVLDTGLSVRLVGIEAPVPERRDREGQPFADEAKRMLEDMALGRQVRLIYPGVTRDRYDRALAYVRTDDGLGPELWLNEEMVRLGGARARVYPDTSRLGDLLVGLETQARNSGKGMWAMAAWAIRDAGEFGPEARGFHILTGRLGALEQASDEDAHCTRSLAGSAIRVNFLSDAAPACDFENSSDWHIGARVQLRGWLNEGQLEVSHVFNAERLGADQ